MRFLLETFIICFTLCQGRGDGQSANGGDACGLAKLDLVIVVDSSGSVGMTNFKKTADFLQDLLTKLPVQADGIRVALVRYATDATVISYLNENMDKAEKILALQNMTYSPGSTYTHKALKLTNGVVLTPAHGDRPDVPDLVVVLTDGVSVYRKLTRSEAMSLKETPSLKILVIGIGLSLNDDELLAMASGPHMVHRVTSFSKLTDIVEGLASLTCSDTSTSSENPSAQPELTVSASDILASTDSVLGPRGGSGVFHRARRPTTARNKSPSPSPPQRKVLQVPVIDPSSSSLTMPESSESRFSSSSVSTLSLAISSSSPNESQSADKVSPSLSESSSPSSLPDTPTSSSLASAAQSSSHIPSPTMQESYSTETVTTAAISDTDVTVVSDLANHKDKIEAILPSSSSLVPPSSVHKTHDHTLTVYEITSSEATRLQQSSSHYSKMTSSLRTTSSTLPHLKSSMDVLVPSMTSHSVSDSLETTFVLYNNVIPGSSLQETLTSSLKATPLLHVTFSPTATVNTISEVVSTSLSSSTPILPSEEAMDIDTTDLGSGRSTTIRQFRNDTHFEPEHKATTLPTDVSFSPTPVGQTSPLVSQISVQQGEQDGEITTGTRSHQKQDEDAGSADLNSSDLYMFVAAGTGAAVILTAASVCTVLACRRRKRGFQPDAESSLRPTDNSVRYVQ